MGSCNHASEVASIGLSADQVERLAEITEAVAAAFMA